MTARCTGRSPYLPMVPDSSCDVAIAYLATFNPVITVVVETLKKRSQFLRIRGGVRKSMRPFLIEAKWRPDEIDASQQNPPLFGFTVTKKLGNAVIRNKIRRRLKSAVAQVAQANAIPGCDYVIVARKAALAMPFTELQKDVTDAIASVNRRLEAQSKQTIER